jgi:hypothetical protein
LTISHGQRGTGKFPMDGAIIRRRPRRILILNDGLRVLPLLGIPVTSFHMQGRLLLIR